MHVLVAWSGFVGALLLVAGPLFPAAVELDTEGDRRAGLTRASQEVDPQERLSPWWWLLPPAAYGLQQRRQRDHRERVFHALTPDEVESFVEFSNVATGWAMVALGALFIALKETYQVAANTVVRIRRVHGLVRSTVSGDVAAAPTGDAR